jgi:gamma-glutamylcyclotransferase (GGCT)/AIG2-like uncharacterized protein YtfP
MKLFVYGTLRKGQAAHDLLDGAEFVTSAWTQAEFTFVDMGGYPGLVDGGRTAVFGEIYEVQAATLTMLDRYEDVPHLYIRVTRVVAGHEVALYLLPEEQAAGRARLGGGDWSQR